MNKNLVKNVGSIGQDNLISKLSPFAECFGIKLKKLAVAGTVKRGTLLSRDTDGSYSIYGGAESEETQKFSGDASSKTFTLTKKPDKVTGVKVGETEITVAEYNQSTGIVTLSDAPAAGTDNVVITYKIANGAVPGAILADDVEVGTTDDETAVAYRSGNFNPAAIIVAENYELTADDIDILRKYGIVFTQMI